jgi:aminoglycoside phosphotransferase (APT) family kinase protein
VTLPGAELADKLSGLFDAPVEGVQRLSGGASRETFSFELARSSDPAGRVPMILQRVRPGPVAGVSSMEAEARLLQAAHSRGVPVAPVVAASDDATIIGAPFIVVHQLPGETIPRRVLRDPEFERARRTLVTSGAEALARIHTIPTAEAPGLPDQDPLESLRGMYDALQPSLDAHPAFELGLRWLSRRRPAGDARGVVHGDFRLGNLLVDGSGLRAVLDWELAHVGDPLEDLAWFSIRAWRFGGPGEVAGLGSLDELVGAYESAGGVRVDRGALHWWRALATLRWGIICMLQTHTHLSGASRSVELATIGRRVCETEYDLLRLIDRTDAEAIS